MIGRASKPDTLADQDLRKCLDSATSFVMVAGAGSGKTTSLVKSLVHLALSRGSDLRKRRQQVACITYTEVARDEIWHDVGEDSLFHVSTIHSFLWTIIKPFQNDIRAWIKSRITEKIAESQAKIDKPRTRATTKEREAKNITRYKVQLEVLDCVPQFNYGTGSDYQKGILGHDDIIKMVPEMLATKPLLRSLVTQGFPFVFVDESQDTLQVIIEVLKLVRSDNPGKFCLGFFGDPMQKIYTTGAGAIPPEEGWVQINKPENFRCPPRVLAVINKIRCEEDPLQQVSGRTDWESEGSVYFFIVPNDGDRSAKLEEVVDWLAEQDPLWRSKDADEGVKLLVIAHRMAANRLGFPDLYSAFNDNTPPSGLKQGFTDGTTWIMTPFLSYLLPLAKAFEKGDGFKTISLLRENSPALHAAKLAGAKPAEVLELLKESVGKLAIALASDSGATISDLLKLAVESNLLALDERWKDHLGERVEQVPAPDGEEVDEGAGKELQVICAFLACPAKQLWGYQLYVNNESVFSTQHGVKGAEFDRVLTILDDEEGSHNQYSYDKYFSLAPPSETDRENIDQGRDSVFERTRRLFYVSCSRATRDLAVVYFTSDVDAARRSILDRQYVSEDYIRLI